MQGFYLGIKVTVTADEYLCCQRMVILTEALFC